MKCKLYSESARQGEANSRGGDGRAGGLSSIPALGWGRWEVGRGWGGSGDPPLLLLHRRALNPPPATTICVNL